MQQWNQAFIAASPQGERYGEICRRIQESLAFVLAGLACAPLVWRRRHPSAALAMSTGAVLLTKALHELERQTRVNEDVIRYMTVRVDEHEAGPSVMMRKSDRDRTKRREREEY